MDTLPMSGVKGSRVQISPARHHDGGLSRLIRAAFIGPRAILERLYAGELGPDWADHCDTPA